MAAIDPDAHRAAFRPPTGEIPTDPGVYRFRDASGRVVYVGKAKNLRARLTSYFGTWSGIHPRTQRMLLAAASVTWTIVGSEMEALQLEYTWIKEFNPPFNVQFRDDKSYPYLAVTLSQEIPRVMITRARRKRGDRYLGPYVNVTEVRETIDDLLNVFPVRSCNEGTLKRAQRTGKPCLLGDIGRCAAPCVGRVTVEEHRRLALDFLGFMSGQDQTYLREVRGRMLEASERLDFEEAARYRDQLQTLERVLAKSAIVLSTTANVDVFGVASDELTAAVQRFIIRQGRVRGVEGWTLDTDEEGTVAGVLEAAIHRAYDPQGEANEPPVEIVVPELPSSHEALAGWLKRSRGGAVRFLVPQRGQKSMVLETAQQNAKEALRRAKNQRLSDYAVRSRALSGIQEALGLDRPPLRIECYDISHLHGEGVVGSMVVFEDGLPKKRDYRSFHIARTRDDTDSMHQVLTRRLARLASGEERTDSFAYPPQLLIVDGGQPQVAAAARALDEYHVAHPDAPRIVLCGLAKRLEEVWLPDDPYPVILSRDSQSLYLLQRVRDEAHRFAITLQRKTRKRTLHTELEQVPGLGPKLSHRLLTEFGSTQRVAQSTVEELTRVPGITEQRARMVLAWLSSVGDQTHPGGGDAN